MGEVLAKIGIPKISLCMIVKDEEEVLRRCLESVKDLVDEFCILDTGSTDSTPEIIKEYGTLRVEPFVNFVETKNKSISYATGEYILWMDADEILKSGHEIIREYVDKGEDVTVLNLMQGGVTYYKTRLWKRSEQAKFAGPNTHEYLNCPFPTQSRYDIIVEEYPKKEKDWSHKFTRDEKLIKEYLDTDSNDLRGNFYLAQTLFAMGKHEEACQYYLKYISLPNNNFKDERLWAAYMCAQSYYQANEVEHSLKMCDSAISIDSRRAEPYYWKGYIYYYKELWNEASVWFERALKCEPPNDVVGFMERDKYFEKSLDYLSICYFKLKDWDNAARVSKTLLTNTHDGPDHLRFVNNANYFTGRTKLKIAMYMGYFYEPIYATMLDDQGLGGVETTYIKLAESFAKLGFEPYVFVTTENHEHKGVKYVKDTEFQDYISAVNFDAIITSRHEGIFDNLNNHPAYKILWLQDMMTFRMGDERKYAHGQDITIVSTNSHKDFLYKSFMHQIGVDNVKVVPIAVNKEFYYTNNIIKEPYRIVYSNSVDRGLPYLFEMWPKIIEQVPQAELYFYYGLDGMKKVCESRNDLPYYERYKSLIDKYTSEYSSIHFMGRVSKEVLAKEQMRSSLAVYPCNFQETFCLTAYEYQLSGTPIVYNPKGALNDTVNKKLNFPIFGDVSSQDTQQKYINTVVGLLNEPEQLQLKRHQKSNREWALNDALDWDQVALLWKEFIYKNV